MATHNPKCLHPLLRTNGDTQSQIAGGGGGLDNERLSEVLAATNNSSCSVVAKELAQTAVELGSTDDVTVVVIKLGPA